MTETRELSARGADLLARLAESRVTVCGAGALGANLCEHLARTGWTQLRAIDHDRVEPHNTANQPFDLRHTGRSKVRTLAEILFEAVGVIVDARHARIDPRHACALLDGSDVVIDALDNVDGRLAVRDACLALGLPCLHVGLAGDGYADLRWNEGYRIAPNANTDPCTVGYTRTLVLVTVALAGEMLVRWRIDKPPSAHELPFETLWSTTLVPFGAKAP